MSAILGIDAAWTEGEPSGVALVARTRRAWKVVAAAPSYAAFVACDRGAPVDWQKRPAGSRPDIAGLLEAARRMTPAEIRVVAIDMPVAKLPFSTRRSADIGISKAFGARGCSTHSPSVRPGALGRRLMDQLDARGFPLETSRRGKRSRPCTIEVYPHAALLALLACDYRVPYKVSRSLRYWPGASRRQRIENILSQLRRVSAGLADVFGRLPVPMPSAGEVQSLVALKKYEDALDAIVCAWVGTRFLEGTAQPYGDDVAAIWVPEALSTLPASRVTP